MPVRTRLSPCLTALLTVTACYRGLDRGPGGADGGDDGADGASDDGGGSADGGGDPAASCEDEGTHGTLAYARRLTPAQYANAITDVFGVAPSARYPSGTGASISGYSTEPGINLIGEQGVADLMYAAEEVGGAVADRVADLLPCADAGDTACASSFLDSFGRRTLRRSLTDDERAELLALFDAERADDASFGEAIALVTSQLLQMPAFLYVVEAPAATGEDRARTGLELASQLSLLLWDSVPDDALLDRAEAGELGDRAAVLEEARRMLDDPRADRALTRFFREWTGTETLHVSDKDAATFPDLDQTLVDAINASFDRLVTAHVRGGGTLDELLTDPKMIVDPTLADWMELDPVDDWTEVALAEDRYAGIATHPALLASLAHASETSFVFRGRFVRKRLLCDAFGAPPPGAMGTFDQLDKPEDPTARELAEVIEAQGACVGCHAVLDPPGVALEHFDAMGAYREAYASGRSIETQGTLAGLSDGEVAFTGPVDMMQAIAAEPRASECLARQVFRFASSRLESEPIDECAVQSLAQALDDGGGRFDELLLAATQTDAFFYRRGE